MTLSQLRTYRRRIEDVTFRVELDDWKGAAERLSKAIEEARLTDRPDAPAP